MILFMILNHTLSLVELIRMGYNSRTQSRLPDNSLSNDHTVTDRVDLHSVQGFT